MKTTKCFFQNLTDWPRYHPHSAQSFAPVVSSMVLEPFFLFVFDIFFFFGIFFLTFSSLGFFGLETFYLSSGSPWHPECSLRFSFWWILSQKQLEFMIWDTSLVYGRILVFSWMEYQSYVWDICLMYWVLVLSLEKSKLHVTRVQLWRSVLSYVWDIGFMYGILVLGRDISLMY